MDIHSAKGLCIALLFIDTLLFGWPPYFLIRGGSWSNKYVHIQGLVISYLTCFAGGVFLGACLLHLLAEGRAEMEAYFKAIGTELQFPVYEAITGGGFFLIALIEQLAHVLLHKSHAHRHSHTNGNVPNSEEVLPHATANNSCSEQRNGIPIPSDGTLGIDNAAYYRQPHSQSNENAPLRAKEVGIDDISVVPVPEYGQTINDSKEDSHPGTTSRSSDLQSSQAQVSYSHKNNGEIAPATSSQDSDIIHVEIPECDKEHEHNTEMVQVLQAMKVTPLRAFLLLGALSFHTIFDGLAVGLKAKESAVWQMFIAICIHKSLVAVCLGTQLFLVFKAQPIKAFLWIFAFSLISPIGVGLGMILTSGYVNDLAKDLASWILQGIATGTFLYVTIFEMLKDEFVARGSVLKIIITMVGFGGMAVAKLLDTD